jgi:Helicase conserved C-terminal domain
MLVLVRETCDRLRLGSAWHTGSVPQQRRRGEINRFKTDPDCRVFLSTDAGATGLNLQVASIVINCDLPWNPAKLEQRIARAWRKNQTRSVSVVNLIAENSIEHSILHLLGQKQALADGLVDGEGDLAALKMPSGRGAFVERMQAMMAAPARAAPRIVSAEEAFVADLVERLGDGALLVELRANGEGRPSLLAVLDADPDVIATERERAAGGPAVEFIEKAAWLSMRRLAACGLVRFTDEARTLHRSPALPPESEAAAAGEERAREAMAEADRTLRMARVLAVGGFPEETQPLLVRSLRNMATALSAQRGEALADPGADGAIRSLVELAALPREALAILDAANGDAVLDASTGVEHLIAATTRILASVRRNEPGLSARAAGP